MAGSKFTIEIVRNLRPEDLRWYSPDDNASASLGINRRYEDLRAFRWDDVETVLEIERDVIAQIEAMTFDEEQDETPESAAIEILEKHEGAQDTWSMWGGPLYGMDLGVASAVIAVSAARCVPFSSCNAGAFGGSHNEPYPCVAFYVRPQLVPLLTACAEKAGVGLTLGWDRTALLFADSVDGIMTFAQVCVDAQADIDAIEVELEPDLIAEDAEVAEDDEV